MSESASKPFILAFSLVASSASCVFHIGSGLADGVAPKECTPYQSGTASWYGRDFHGKRTASGIPFDMNDLVAAHKRLPFGTQLRVSFNKKSVMVRIVDRGPYHGKRIIDLSRKAADTIGLRERGTGRVSLEICRKSPWRKQRQ